MTDKASRWPNNLSNAEFAGRIAALNARFMGAILGLGVQAIASSGKADEERTCGVGRSSPASQGEEVPEEVEATEAA